MKQVPFRGYADIMTTQVVKLLQKYPQKECEEIFSRQTGENSYSASSFKASHHSTQFGDLIIGHQTAFVGGVAAIDMKRTLYLLMYFS